MVDDILETRRAVMSAIIRAYPGGRACAAARLGISLKRLDNQIYGNRGAAPLSDDQLYQLEQDTGTRYLADYITHLYGGVFVKLPANDAESLDLYANSLNTSAHRGKVDELIHAALDDGVIDSAEAQAIQAAHIRHLVAREEEVRAVILLHQRRVL
ncbi:YmfL family putative regulatory protein [Celerinatantimonas sp. MCCC 1A17872]|uniref:YmfL family putative regulatory protein n=1 Tax=Celerinatantimonas sp. MCCC 1A17872 TaxID=3177514 RepID=UPI0038C4B789